MRSKVNGRTPRIACTRIGQFSTAPLPSADASTPAIVLVPMSDLKIEDTWRVWHDLEMASRHGLVAAEVPQEIYGRAPVGNFEPLSPFVLASARGRRVRRRLFEPGRHVGNRLSGVHLDEPDLAVCGL